MIRHTLSLNWKINVIFVDCFWAALCNCDDCSVLSILYSGRMHFCSVLASVLYTWSLYRLRRCQLWFLFLCVGCIEFLYLIQCFITDQCFITVLSWQLNNCLTTFVPDKRVLLRFTGCKKKKLWKAAHNLCLLDVVRLVSTPFIYECFSEAVYSERRLLI